MNRTIRHRIAFVMALACLMGALQAFSQEVQKEVQPGLIEITPELSPFQSRIEASHNLLKALVERQEPLDRSDLETLGRISQEIDTMQSNIENNKTERPYLRHLKRPLSQMESSLDAAINDVQADKPSQAKRHLKRAYRIANALYTKPTVQMIVAEQEIAVGTELMADKQYDAAVKKFDAAINRLSQIPSGSQAPYGSDLARIKSNVLALRRQARQKTISTPMDRFVKDLAQAFNTAHETSFGIWSGPMDMQKLR